VELRRGGETDDAEILALRAKQQRNYLTTLLLSQGTPMLLGGDELSRTQGGNNNGWCQDNEISWYDWDIEGRAGARDLKEFTQRLIALRRAEPVFRRTQFLDGEQSAPGLPDVWWFRRDGRRMTRRDWENPEHAGSGSSSTGRRPACVTATARRSRATRSSCCSTPTTRTRSSASPPGASAPVGRWS